MKAHGLPTKSVTRIVRDKPEEAIEAFFDEYEKTKERFKKRDSSLMSGTFWMRAKKDRDATWELMERCRDLAMRYQLAKQ